MPRKLTEQQKAHAADWLDLLELLPLKYRKFKFISSGEQRLILLIRALIKNPPLLILDEPCQGLDQEQKDHFRNVIEYLCAASDNTLIYVSHYREEIPGCVDKVLRLEKGKEVEEKS
jgi:molybdate transport system ATP-binding protein